MKKLVSLFLLLSSLNALACIGNICVGDIVIPNEFRNFHNSESSAKVLSINPKTKMVTTQTAVTGQINTFPAEEIAQPFGCIEKYCVGHKVLIDELDALDRPQKNSGVIVAINYSKKLLTIQKYKEYYVYFPTFKVALQRGCMQGICVGDMVKQLPYVANKFFVKAINPEKKLFTILINNDPRYENVYFPELYLDKEAKEFNKKNSMPCIGDICVGDLVIPNSFWDYTRTTTAKVLSFNPQTKMVTTQETLTGKVENFPAREISVKFGCLGKFCVGHKVLLDHADRKAYGEIVAINFYKKVLTIKNDKEHYSHLAPFVISIQRGCMKGFCVGDMVKLAPPSTGKYFVTSISPERNLFTVLVNNDPYWDHEDKYFAEMHLDRECIEFNKKMRQ